MNLVTKYFHELTSTELYELLKDGIMQIKEILNPSTIFIEAQCYATGFYEREGFVISSDEFLEDGIPHVEMILKL